MTKGEVIIGIVWIILAIICWFLDNQTSSKEC